MLWRVLCFDWANVIFSSLSFRPLRAAFDSPPFLLSSGVSTSLSRAKTFAHPKKAAALHCFGEVSFHIQVYTTCICSLVFTKIQSLGFIAFSKPNSFCNKILSQEQLWLEERTHSKQFHAINKTPTMGLHWSDDNLVGKSPGDEVGLTTVLF